MAKREEIAVEPLSFASPVVGTVLTVAAGLAFQFLCMVLPLVGKAGMHPDREYAVRGMLNVPGPHGFDSYVLQNRITFLVVLFVALALAVAATISRLQRRKMDGGPFPKFSAILAACCMGLLLAHVTGLLQI